MALSLMTDPFFDQLFGDMSRGRGRELGTLAAPAGALSSLHINCDVVERPDRYSIIADAPGMSGDDIQVELQDGTLKVSGEKSRQHEEGKQGHKVWRQERSFQKFQRCFSLPEDANPDAINAKLEHGVLTVEVPKLAQTNKAEPKRIKITQGGSK
ncbi:HSP20-like chaperone [Dunaliella salina]|uniref:HSP20-like chaperone n=1 Tax=Dunaliella salina TaxID=3046 RepID=A0ABQ7GVF4_DUNSA|nr:HSP20-like chaperone [Dunaliella salina]|eukprot:KAF5838578.1 HSP20-like chaperone [Dunaliella salina]